MRSFLLLFLLVFLFSCGGSSGAATSANGNGSSAGADLERPDITVTIKGAAPGTVSLIGQYTDQQFRADTAQADASGTVVFEREEPYLPGFYFAYFSDGSAAQMLVDEDQTFSLTADKSDITGSMQVSGSTDNELLYRGINFEKGLQEKFRAAAGLEEQRVLVEERRTFYEGIFNDHPTAFYTSYKRAGQNPTLRSDLPNDEQVTAYRYDFWDDVDFSDIRLLRTPVIANKLKRYVNELTPQNADSVIRATDYLINKSTAGNGDREYLKFFANFITLQFEPGKTAVMDGAAIHVHMIRNYFNRDVAFWADSMTVYGLQQRADQMAQSLVGQIGPNVSVPGTDGKPKALFDEDAPFVIVYMYNPDCDHCQEQTPKLVNWHRQNRREVDVYAIAIDTERDSWLKFVEDYRTGDFTNVFDPTNRSIFKTYYVDNTPELYLLNAERRIVAKNLKVAQLDQALELAKSR